MVIKPTELKTLDYNKINWLHKKQKCISRLNIKIKSFEYLTKLFIDWFKEENPIESDNYKEHFSKLKLMKLLFFTAAVDTNKNNDGLLDIFNNFHALPYGPVDLDVY